MALEDITTSEATLAETFAKQIISQIKATADRVSKLRKDGFAGTPAIPARTLPDGRVIPAQEAQGAVSGAAIDAKLGAQNVAIISALSDALK